MAASGMGMGYGPGPNPVHMGMPRVNSALSHVSYPSTYANPVVQMPRTYSYSSMQPPQGWSHQGGEVVYSSGNQSGMGWKGKEVEKPPMIDSGRASRSSSKGLFNIHGFLYSYVTYTGHSKLSCWQLQQFYQLSGRFGNEASSTHQQPSNKRYG